MDLVSFTDIGTSDDVKGDDLKDDEVKLLTLVSAVHNYVFDAFKSGFCGDFQQRLMDRGKTEVGSS